MHHAFLEKKKIVVALNKCSKKFIYNEESKLKDLDQMDCVREKVYDAIKHINYNKWLNVSFTGDKKWAI